MEFKKVEIEGKEFEFVSSMENDEYEVNEVDIDLEDTLDLSEMKQMEVHKLEDTIKIKRVEESE